MVTVIRRLRFAVIPSRNTTREYSRRAYMVMHDSRAKTPQAAKFCCCRRLLRLKAAAAVTVPAFVCYTARTAMRCLRVVFLVCVASSATQRYSKTNSGIISSGLRSHQVLRAVAAVAVSWGKDSRAERVGLIGRKMKRLSAADGLSALFGMFCQTA